MTDLVLREAAFVLYQTDDGQTRVHGLIACAVEVPTLSDHLKRCSRTASCRRTQLFELFE